MKLIEIFINHWKKFACPKLYLPQLVLLLAILFINYSLDLEDGWADPMVGFSKYLALFALVFVPYILSTFLLNFSGYPVNFWSARFWMYSILCFAFFTLYRNFDFSVFVDNRSEINYKLLDFYNKSIRNLFELGSIFLFLLLLAIFYTKTAKEFFYSHKKASHLTTYLIILALMLIPIYFVSSTKDFQEQYPYFKAFDVDFLSQKLEKSITQIKIYLEVIYAARFVFVEFFFRGILIFVMLRFFGEVVIIPTAMAYCAIHFGKPWVEATSSFFGGYVLGLLALKTKNIYGGIVVHMGIAVGMDLFALLNS